MARVNSQRFPGKVYLNLQGKPMWWHVLSRVEAGARVAGVELSNACICTTADESNDILERQARQYGYDCFRWDGPEWNVVGRQLACMEHYNVGISFTAGGDCPLCWYETANLDHDCVSTVNHNLSPIWTHGDPWYSVPSVTGGVNVHPAWLYELTAMIANAPDELEHGGLAHARDWARRPEHFIPPPRSAFRALPEEFYALYRPYTLDVDTPMDGVQMMEIYQELYKGEPIRCRDAIAYIDAHQEYHRNADKEPSAVNKTVRGADITQAQLRYQEFVKYYLEAVVGSPIGEGKELMHDRQGQAGGNPG